MYEVTSLSDRHMILVASLPPKGGNHLVYFYKSFHVFIYYRFFYVLMEEFSNTFFLFLKCLVFFCYECVLFYIVCIPLRSTSVISFFILCVFSVSLFYSVSISARIHLLPTCICIKYFLFNIQYSMWFLGIVCSLSLFHQLDNFISSTSFSFLIFLGMILFSRCH